MLIESIKLHGEDGSWRVVEFITRESKGGQDQDKGGTEMSSFPQLEYEEIVVIKEAHGTVGYHVLKTTVLGQC